LSIYVEENEERKIKKEYCMFKKNDRVKCVHNGETLHGTVTKRRGRKLHVIIDGKTNSELIGSMKCFEASEKPLPVDEPSVMDKWSVKGYKEIEGHGDSPTFSAYIYLNNKKVIHVSNNGWGGCNSYQTTKQGYSKYLNQFLKDADEWSEQFKNPLTFDKADTWVEWKQFSAPYGETAKIYFENMKKQNEEYKEKYKV
jgi:hypothetical protein